MQNSIKNVLLFLSVSVLFKIYQCADLVIHIPGNLGHEGDLYRLDYTPPHGHPAPNTTIASKDIKEVIKFSQALPGTNYYFWLYYSNSTHNTLTWTANFTTVPDPPSNLSVSVRSGKVTVISWSPPTHGSYSSFKLKLTELSKTLINEPRIFKDISSPYTIDNLTPGATYQISASTIFENKESVAYTTRNFTTKPNTPGKFIVWFRNETTLLVLWQPPYPPAIYTHYKASIQPPDALESVLFVEKEGEPPGPAQAAFKSLIPGRAYNISVQTMSEDEVSTPTTAQYRTVPLRVFNVTIDKKSVTSHSFIVRWEAPRGKCEFDKYQLTLNNTTKKFPPTTRPKSGPLMWEFKDYLEPGRTYSLLVKSVSGKVTSWPITAEVTLKPLPVINLRTQTDKNGNLYIRWDSNPDSYQEEWMISYHEVESSSADSNTIRSNTTSLMLDDVLLPGRNYSVSVQAVSKKAESNESHIYVLTMPSAPIIEDLRPITNGLNISWKSDVNSRQDNYEIQWIRNDTMQKREEMTYDSHIVLEDLYPGAGYIVKVFAISHDIPSEPHEYFQPVFPKPPTNLTIDRSTTNSIILQWLPPTDSLVSEYTVRYRTDSDPSWVKLPLIPSTEAEILDMTPGELYTIQVNTVSYGLESNDPQQLNHTVRPNPVSNIAPLVDSNNVTLEWPRPEGRVERYVVSWKESSEDWSDSHNIRNVSQNQKDIGPVRTLVGHLMPGVEYTFNIQAISYDLESDITTFTTRTSKLPITLIE